MKKCDNFCQLVTWLSTFGRRMNFRTQLKIKKAYQRWIFRN
jgi:hypothetical protein